MDKLIKGLQQFQQQAFAGYKALFDELAPASHDKYQE